MAGRKLSDLTTTTSLSDNDLVYVVDVSAAAGSKSKGIAKSDLAALMGTTAAATQPVENEYADITALLADQGNQTTGFLQYVVDASADPNITSGEAYYEKLATSTATLADDYRLLSDTETEIIKDSNSYRVFRIQDIQDEGTPLTSVSGGKVSFEYSGANVTAILFNKLYTDAIEEFYGKDVSIRFHNRATKRYETEAVASTAWTTVNTDYYRAEVAGTNIQIADLSVNNRLEFFIVEATSVNLSNYVQSNTTGEPTGSDQILNVVSLTQSEYDAGTPVATTLYVITDAVDSTTEYLDFACSDETSSLAIGTVYEKELLRGYSNVSKFDFSVTTAPTGSTIIIDVKKNGTTVYSTKATIDATETSTLTAATAQVLAAPLSFVAGDVLEVVIDQVGSTVAGVGLLCQMTYNV